VTSFQWRNTFVLYRLERRWRSRSMPSSATPRPTCLPAILKSAKVGLVSLTARLTGYYPHLCWRSSWQRHYFSRRGDQNGCRANGGTARPIAWLRALSTGSGRNRFLFLAPQGDAPGQFGKRRRRRAAQLNGRSARALPTSHARAIFFGTSCSLAHSHRCQCHCLFGRGSLHHESCIELHAARHVRQIYLSQKCHLMSTASALSRM